MFQSRWDFGLMAKDALALRQAVLVDEMGLPPSSAFDRYDEIAAHVYVWDDQGPIAAGRIFPLGDATAIGAIVTAPAHRQDPFADLVLRLLLDKAQTLAGDPILASPLQRDVPLYASFGITAIPSAPNTYSVPKGAIRWHSACQGEG